MARKDTYNREKTQDKKREQARQRIRFGKMQTVILAFAVLSVILYLVQRNVSYKEQDRLLEPAAAETFSEKVQEQEAECLILWENDINGKNGCEMMGEVLEQMRIPYDTCEGERLDPSVLDNYQNVVLSMTHLNLLKDGLLEVVAWTEAGGGLMILYPPEVNGSFQSIEYELGIKDVGGSMALIQGLHFPRSFMIGGQEKDYVITDPYESALSVALDDACEVYLESTDERPVPLIWKRAVGEGTVVVNNLGYLGKAYRGFYASSYSLLQEVCVYPVINASTFYIDDFPSPVPEGGSKYIQDDYGMTIDAFYTQIWWRDVYNLAEQYDIRYTGLVIEQYSDQVKAPFQRNRDIQRFRYFGNMLLKQGGELGFHGYNHMPLCLYGFDYGGGYESYRLWKSYDDMKASLEELQAFCRELFPKEVFQVYVPPSNVLSEDGREMLAEEFPEIRAVASVYLPGETVYVQEFEVAEDGLIETPRIISGYLMDDFTQLTALAELNFHFVNTHFQHPDDILDEDRGAALGWEELGGRFSSYLEWLYTSAPQIRNLTGTELAGAVQIYDMLALERTYENGELKLSLSGFGGEAWLMLRISEGEPVDAEGAQLTRIQEGIYLVQATEPEVCIRIEA